MVLKSISYEEEKKASGPGGELEQKHFRCDNHNISDLVIASAKK